MRRGLLIVVSLVIQFKGGTPIGTGTGFFYIKDNALYFVTNRHIVINEKKKIKPDTLRLKLHIDPNDLTKNQNYDIKLYSNGKPIWYEHKDYEKNEIDIAIIKLDIREMQKKYVIKAVGSHIFLPKEYEIPPGQDVFVLGYPRGISDIKHNLPLARNAMVSSAYPLNFEGQPYFMIDAILHPGMSGSPVFTKPSNIWVSKQGGTDVVTGNPIYFLGIFSDTVSKRGEYLALNQVWYANLIEDIIESSESEKNKEKN